MAGLKHKTVGSQLTQGEWEADTSHDISGGATGDILYLDSGGNIVRLPVGSASNILQSSGGLPAWTSTPSFGAVVATSLNLSDGNITNAGDIALDSLSADNLSIAITLANSAGGDLIVGNNNALVVEGDNDRVGIGILAPLSRLHVSDGASGVTPHADTKVLIENNLNTSLEIASGLTSLGRLIFSDSNGTNHYIEYDHAVPKMNFVSDALTMLVLSGDDDTITIGNSATEVDLQGSLTVTNNLIISDGILSVIRTSVAAILTIDGNIDSYIRYKSSGADVARFQYDHVGGFESKALQIRNGAGGIQIEFGTQTGNAVFGGSITGNAISGTSLTASSAFIATGTADIIFGNSAVNIQSSNGTSTGNMVFNVGTGKYVFSYGASSVTPNASTTTFFENSGNNYLEIGAGTSSTSRIMFSDSNRSDNYIQCTHDVDNPLLEFWSAGTKIIEIDGEDPTTTINSAIVVVDEDLTLTAGDLVLTIGSATIGGSATISGDLLFNTSGGGLQCGGISAENNAVETTINTQNDWEQVLVFDTNDASNGATPDHTNDHITILKTGIYMAQFSASVISAGSNKVYEFEVRSNDGTVTHTNVHCDRKISTAGDVGALGGSGLISFTANDTVELWVRNKTDTTNLTFEDLTLTIFQVAG